MEECGGASLMEERGGVSLMVALVCAWRAARHLSGPLAAACWAGWVPRGSSPAAGDACGAPPPWR